MSFAGLTARPKRLSPKYFYDETGARLFEHITLLPEYYPTRAELSILRDNAAEIAGLVPDGAALVEFGSGSSIKARILLSAAPKIAAYVPVDISSEMLTQEADEVRRDFPQLTVLPVEADFTKPFRLPSSVAELPLIGFFPGSTIGNFEPHEASSFLRHARQILGVGSTLIIGLDLVKDAAVLNAAYNDAAGITAKFNLNLLTRINRELDANFDLTGFCHQAFYNSERHRIEMHLASKKRQKVRVAGRSDRLPRRRNDPHREQLQIHARIRSARWRAGRAGRLRRCGPTRTSIFPFRCWSRRTSEVSSEKCLAAGRDARSLNVSCRSVKPIPGACNTSRMPPVRRT